MPEIASGYRFFPAGRLGDSKQVIGTIEESGVALAAIQGLDQKFGGRCESQGS
jgi:hypothetical protein